MAFELRAAGLAAGLLVAGVLLGIAGLALTVLAFAAAGLSLVAVDFTAGFLTGAGLADASEKCGQSGQVKYKTSGFL